MAIIIILLFILVMTHASTVLPVTHPGYYFPLGSKHGMLEKLNHLHLKAKNLPTFGTFWNPMMLSVHSSHFIPTQMKLPMRKMSSGMHKSFSPKDVQHFPLKSNVFPFKKNFLIPYENSNNKMGVNKPHFMNNHPGKLFPKQGDIYYQAKQVPGVNKKPFEIYWTPKQKAPSKVHIFGKNTVKPNFVGKPIIEGQNKPPRNINIITQYGNKKDHTPNMTLTPDVVHTSNLPGAEKDIMPSTMNVFDFGRNDKPKSSDQPNPGSRTFEINPGSRTFEINPGSRTFEINPGSRTFEINPGSRTFEVNPSSRTFEVNPSPRTFEIVPLTVDGNNIITGHATDIFPIENNPHGLEQNNIVAGHAIDVFPIENSHHTEGLTQNVPSIGTNHGTNGPFVLDGVDFVSVIEGNPAVGKPVSVNDIQVVTKQIGVGINEGIVIPANSGFDGSLGQVNRGGFNGNIDVVLPTDGFMDANPRHGFVSGDLSAGMNMNVIDGFGLGELSHGLNVNDNVPVVVMSGTAVNGINGNGNVPAVLGGDTRVSHQIVVAQAGVNDATIEGGAMSDGYNTGGIAGGVNIGVEISTRLDSDSDSSRPDANISPNTAERRPIYSGYMLNIEPFGPGPYGECRMPSRVVCGARVGWEHVTGMNQWCQRNCVVYMYTSYCDDDRCRCRCTSD